MYTSICMARYLLPETNLTVSEKTDIFALRSQMNENPCNFWDKINCQMGCSQIQENEHILNCPQMDGNEIYMNLEDLRNGPEYKQLEVLRRFNKNTNRIKQHLWDSVNTVNPL